jgi:hypothetical protein
MARKIRIKEVNPRPTRKTTEVFIQQARILHNDKYDYSKTVYILNNIPVIVICPHHGEFATIPQNHLKIHKNKNWKATGCPSCGKELVISRNKAGTLTDQEFLDRAQEIHDYRYEYISTFAGYHYPIIIKCNKHGEFKQTANNHLRGTGCPRCKNSKGSTKVAKILTSVNIDYIPEYSFDDCKGDKKELFFDFYLPSLNILIEYDGEQHYRPVRFNPKMTMAQAQTVFDKAKRYDFIKNQYCLVKNIRLIRVPYFEKDMKGFLHRELGI